MKEKLKNLVGQAVMVEVNSGESFLFRMRGILHSQPNGERFHLWDTNNTVFGEFGAGSISEIKDQEITITK